MKVIAVCGLAVTGKNTVAEVLEEAGYTLLDYTRDVLTPLLKENGLDVNRPNLSMVAEQLRKEKGRDILTVLLAKKIQGKSVITGLRDRTEAQYLRKRFGKDFLLIGVTAQPEIRYERAVRRGIKGEGKLTLEEFLANDQLPTETIIFETLKEANVILENNSTPQELKRKIKKILD